MTSSHPSNPLNSNSLQNRLVWITGASRGIGAALARALAHEGCRLALSARYSSTLASIDAGLRQEFPNLHNFVQQCNVAEAASVQEFVSAMVQYFGAVPDMLINNAGTAVFAPFADISLEDFDATLNTNLRGVFLCTQAMMRDTAIPQGTTAPGMITRGTGVLVNINSISATTTFAGGSVYAASKAGLLAMSRGIRADVRSQGIKVIDVLPGATETDIWDTASRAQFSPRMMQPEDIAEAVVAVLKLHPRVMPEELVLRPQLGDL